MKNRLPVYIEENELPLDNKILMRSNSYGYVNIMYILSLIITGVSVLVLILLRIQVIYYE